MGQNFNYREGRDRLRQMRGQNLKTLRTRLRRADDGKVLGVFKGIADSMGWSVCWTRILGAVVLLSLGGLFGVDGFSATLLSWGFFYLLLYFLMGPARTSDEHAAETPAGDSGPGVDWRARRREFPSAAGSSVFSPRVDLASLDRQFESLNRRIRRMESVVTDPGYDWERRLGK